MLKFICAESFFEYLIKLLSDFGKNITSDGVLIIGCVSFLILLVYTVLRLIFVYESKLMRSVNKLNAFLIKNPYVDENNLMELNSLMKKVPKTLRAGWQEFMLNRDNLPGEYINDVACLEKADKNSPYLSVIRSYKSTGIVIALIVALLSFSVYYGSVATSLIGVLFQVCFLPLFIISLCFIGYLSFQARYTVLMNDLRYEFHEMVRSLNKACTTMPPYVDYEVLFTQKEIESGIPVLQEYLEKKAFEEQREKEEKETAGNTFEKFDFNELGIENAILLDRAMLECEKYFNAKRSLTERVTQKEQEYYKFSKQFDEVTKDFERKAQTHRENMTTLTEQLNNTTIKIEANYTKKRYTEEQQKLQQLEKDYEIAKVRFNKQQAEIESEMKALNDEISSRKDIIEEAMKNEGKTYANKIYGIINKAIVAQNEPIMKKTQEERAVLLEEVEQLRKVLDKHNAEIEIKNEQIENLEKELQLKLAQIEAVGNVKEYFSSREFRDRVLEIKKRKPDEDEAMPGFENVGELKAKLAKAEEQLKLANEKQKELIQKENQLIERLNKVENNHDKLDSQLEETQISNAKKLSASADKLSKLQASIDNENKKYIKNNADLEKTVKNVSNEAPK